MVQARERAAGLGAGGRRHGQLAAQLAAALAVRGQREVQPCEGKSLSHLVLHGMKVRKRWQSTESQLLTQRTLARLPQADSVESGSRHTLELLTPPPFYPAHTHENPA